MNWTSKRTTSSSLIVLLFGAASVLQGTKPVCAEMLLTTIDLTYDSGDSSIFEFSMRAVLKLSNARRIFGFNQQMMTLDWQNPRDVFRRSNEGMRLGEFGTNPNLIRFSSDAGRRMTPPSGWFVDRPPTDCGTGFTCAVDSEITPGPGRDLFGSGYHASFLEVTYDSWEHINTPDGFKRTTADFTLQLFGGLGEVPEPSSGALMLLSSVFPLRAIRLVRVYA